MARGGQRGNNHNWQGVGGLGERPWDRWDPDRPYCRTCAGRRRRTGEPCRAPPVRGNGYCRLHGAFAGRGRRRLPKSERTLRNQEIHLARRMARAELAQTTLAAATWEAWRDYFAKRVCPADAERFLLYLDTRTRSELTPAAWAEVRRIFGV
jgi:hypothetical protein